MQRRGQGKETPKHNQNNMGKKAKDKEHDSEKQNWKARHREK